MTQKGENKITFIIRYKHQLFLKPVYGHKVSHLFTLVSFEKKRFIIPD